MARTATAQPARRSRRQAQEPEPVEQEANGQKDYTPYATKNISIVMERFADWLIDEVGLEFTNARAEDNFRKGVALGGTLRMDFQKSEFWRESDDNPRNRVAEEEEEAPAPRSRRRAAAAEPEPAAPKSRRSRRQEPVEPEPIEDEDDDEPDDDDIEDEDEDDTDDDDTEVEPEPAPKPASRRSGRQAKPATAPAAAAPAAASRPASRRSGRRAKPAAAEEGAPSPY